MKTHHSNCRLTLRSLFAAAAAALVLPQISSAQLVTNWTAFNEHAPSALTDPNVSAYNMRGWVLGTDPGTVHPLSGPLTNYITGGSGYGPGQSLNAQLVASTLLRNPDLFPAAALGYPDPGTPAYDFFMPGGAQITDLGNAGSGIGLGNFSGGVGQDTVVLTFNNLDPSMSYQFRGTVVRAGTADTHYGRWTGCSIAGAVSSVDAATPGVLTSANVPGVPGLTLTNGQQVFQSGINRQGDMVGWTDIKPGPDGSFSIITKGYNGPVYDYYDNMGPGHAPGAGSRFTNAHAALGYALTDIALTEYGPLTPVSIAIQPTPTTTLTEFYPLTLSVKAFGTAPLYQWYKDAVAIPGANAATYSVPVAAAGDSGTYTVVVNNSQNSLTSTPALVTVLEDNVKPTVVSASDEGSLTQVFVQFNERVNLADAGSSFSYSISGGNDPSGVVVSSAGSTESGTRVVLTTGAPLLEDTVYQLTISSISDLAGNVCDSSQTYSFRTWVATAAGGVKFEVFTGIGGTAVSALTSAPSYPNSPAVVTNLTSFNSREFLPTDSLENYGGRMRALFIPPTSEDYIFYLRSDDASELYFNPTGSGSGGKVLITAETACCTAYDAHASAPQSLIAGKFYYLELLYKEGGGGDYGQVAVKRASDPADPNTLSTIPSGMIGQAALRGSSGEIGITQQPANLTTNDNQLAIFSVTATNTFNLPMSYQWLTNGVVVPGANGSSAGIIARIAENNLQVSVVVSIPGFKVTSTAAALSVIADTVRPLVLSASGNAGLTQVIVQFNELITKESAENSFGYEIAAGPTGPGNPGAFSAVLQPDGRTVVVNFNAPFESDSTYTLLVSEATDIAGNVIATGTTVQVKTWKIAPGFVTFETYNAGGGNAVSILTSHPSFPNSPRETLYITAFDTRKVYPDDSHDNYGGRLTGVFIPPTSGNWIFYLNADDGSELYLNPAGPAADGKVLIQSRADCCATFAANASTPQSLTAGQVYYLEALYKEGGGGDYCRVAAKLETDPADPATLTPIPGAWLGTFVNPVGLSIAVTANPESQIVPRSFPAQSFGIEDFNTSGGFTVLSGIEGGTAPSPVDSWLHKPAQGTWSVLGADGVRNSALSSPFYVVTTAGAVSMTFDHRYNFEKDTVNWDGGLVRVSVNRGPYITVPGTSITGETYATDRTIGGNCPPIRGQFAFNGQSAGFVTSTYVSSTAALGTFNAGDVVSVQFIAGWDEGTIAAPSPAWEIASVNFSPSVENSSADRAVTFTAAASATVSSAPVAPYYQWQRDDGAGFVDIANANGASYTFIPSAGDDGVAIRCVVSAPGSSSTTTTAVLSVVPRHTIVLSGSTAVISWPAPSTGYVLEQASALATPGPTIWSPVGIAPTVSGGMNSVTITGAGSGQKFYQLRK